VDIRRVRGQAARLAARRTGVGEGHSGAIARRAGAFADRPPAGSALSPGITGEA
jgi:hypothetical protein